MDVHVLNPDCLFAAALELGERLGLHRVGSQKLGRELLFAGTVRARNIERLRQAQDRLQTTGIMGYLEMCNPKNSRAKAVPIYRAPRCFIAASARDQA